MDVRQRRTLQIAYELLEVIIGLARKTDDDVGSDRRIANACPDAVDQLGVLCERIGAPHRVEHTVARMLQRQVKVTRKAPLVGDERHDLARTIHRLQRADPKAYAGSAIIDLRE